MIPKVIHYCWFGNNPLPPEAERCIASWRKHFPDWEIRRWDESNFDVRIVPFTAQAYDMGKYAFVSDYARFYVLYRYGGIYFDTDVEVIRSFHDIISRGAFMGMEYSNVAPGLGLGVEAGHPLYAELLERYDSARFIDEDGHLLPGTVVSFTTDIFRKHGFRLDGLEQNIMGITIYPNDWFCPFDDLTGRLKITDNTHSIHHYAKSWCDDAGPLRTWISRLSHRLFGFKLSACLKKLLKIC